MFFFIFDPFKSELIETINKKKLNIKMTKLKKVQIYRD